ncbi:MAG: hypothetical protein WCQ60_00630 [bacterium]
MNATPTDGAVLPPSLVYRHYTAMHAVIIGPDNTWFTGEAVGHSPSFDEKLFHFLRHGQDAFRRNFVVEHPEAAGVWAQAA